MAGFLSDIIDLHFDCLHLYGGKIDPVTHSGGVHRLRLTEEGRKCFEVGAAEILLKAGVDASVANTVLTAPHFPNNALEQVKKIGVEASGWAVKHRMDEDPLEPAPAESIHPISGLSGRRDDMGRG